MNEIQKQQNEIQKQQNEINETIKKYLISKKYC